MFNIYNDKKIPPKYEKLYVFTLHIIFSTFQSIQRYKYK